MKRNIFITGIILILGVATCTASEKTLLGSKNFSMGGFGGPTVMWSTFNGEHVPMVGGQGAFVISKTVYLGGGGYGMARELDGGQVNVVGHPNSFPTNMHLGYGGGLVGVILKSDDMIHLNADAMVGGGAVARSIKNAHDYSIEQPHGIDSDQFFFVQPMVHAEVNVTTWMRTSVSAGYRFVSGVDSYGLSNSDVGGPIAGLTFRFGKW